MTWFCPIVGSAIAAVVMMYVKPQCNRAIFICALIGIILCGILLAWEVIVNVQCWVDNGGQIIYYDQPGRQHD